MPARLETGRMGARTPRRVSDVERLACNFKIKLLCLVVAGLGGIGMMCVEVARTGERRVATLTTDLEIARGSAAVAVSVVWWWAGILRMLEHQTI